MTETLVVYYSHSGNTRSVAEQISRMTGADIAEISVGPHYPEDYDSVVAQAKREIDSGFQPEIEADIRNIDQYSTVIVGTPNWWSTVAPPVSAFLSKYDLSGKTVVPFCTHGGGGLSKIPDDIKKLCKGAKVRESLGINGNRSGSSSDEIGSWLDKLGFVVNLFFLLSRSSAKLLFLGFKDC